MEIIKPYLEHVKGNTYCIVMSAVRIPIYKLNATDAIMIDSGYARGLGQSSGFAAGGESADHLRPDLPRASGPHWKQRKSVISSI